MFLEGSEPPCMDEADVDGSGGANPIDIADVIYLVDYMFQGGDAPADCPDANPLLNPFGGFNLFMSNIIIIEEPPLNITSLSSSYANGFTTISLSTTIALKGLEINVSSDSTIAPVNLMNNNMDFLYHYADNNLRIGIFDPMGDSLISSGTQDIIQIPGNHPVSSSIAVDENNYKMTVLLLNQ